MAALGFAATAIVVLGGTLAGGATRGEGFMPWGVPAIPVEPSVHLALALSLFYGGMILLVRSWLNLRRLVLRSTAAAKGQPFSKMTVVGVALIWAVPLFAGPPLGSRDVYAYEAQGRMAELGLDVYEVGPGALGDDPAVAAMDPIYLESPVVYGPVFVALSSGVSRATSSSVAAVYLFRLLAVVGLGFAGWAVAHIAARFGRDEADALVLTIANPLILLHLVSGAHNEAIMLAFLVGGIALGTGPADDGRLTVRRVVGATLCSVGAAVKIPALVGVAFVGWPWVVAGRSSEMRGLRIALAAVYLTAVLGLSSYLTGWGWGWLRAMQVARPVDAYLSVTRVFGGAVHFLTGTELDPVLQVVRVIGLGMAAVATAYLVMRSKQPAPVSSGWSLLLFAVMHPTTQPWYLSWGLLLIAAGSAGTRSRAFVVLSAFASFVVLPVGPQLGLALLEDTGAGMIALTMAVLVLLTFSPMPAPREPDRADLQVDLVSVIVPTRNEGPNIAPLVRRVGDSFAQDSDSPGRVELIFVDDSDDETSAVIQELVDRSASSTWSGPVVKLAHRHQGGRWGGLGGAVVDGFAVASGTIAVVIDGDLQHPPEKIPTLVRDIRSGADLVVASRRIEGGSGGEGLTITRDWMSRFAGRMSRLLFPQRVGRVQDPLSGFFALRLDRIDQTRLHPDGFKILIEVLATHPGLATAEIPYRFTDREEGQSKADLGQGVRFFSHLLDLRLRTCRPWAGAVGSQREFRSA